MDSAPADSLDTALEVLRQFEMSLRRAGFAEGSAAYHEMAGVLLRQRLWAQANDSDADPRYAQIGAHARAIHALLAPYADSMLRLSAVAADDPAPAPAAAPPTGPAAQVLRALHDGGRLSFTALRAQLRLDGGELQRLLAELAAAGTITCRRASGRDVYTLAGEP
jgi:hypothetical protein